MKNHKLISMLICSCLLASCCTPKYTYRINKLRNSTAKILAQKHNLTFSGFGGNMTDGIKTVFLSFDCKRPLTIAQARKLIIDCIDTTIKKINADKQLKKYILPKFPATSQNIEITVDIRVKRSFGSLIFVSARDNYIYYWTYEKTNDFSLAKSETIEEAKNTLKSSPK